MTNKGNALFFYMCKNIAIYVMPYQWKSLTLSNKLDFTYFINNKTYVRKD